LTALFFSAFIYFEEYELTNKLINSLFGLIAIALFLYIPKKSVLIAGFFIGLFWFYWVGYSFKYQGVGYMESIVTVIFGLFYMLFFAPLAFSKQVYIRAFLLFLLSFFEPLGNNWMQIELLFVDSYFGVYKYQFIAILLALSLPSFLKDKLKYTPLLLLLVAFNYGYPPQNDAPLKIKLVQTHIKQEAKWKRESLLPTTSMIFKDIDKAIQEKVDIVLFPESVFPLYMNKNPVLINELLQKSDKITIVVGSLLREDDKSYNVTYMFTNGEYQIAKKVVLLPFGEYIPLPKFAQKIINDTFFHGASDFVHADKPTDFIIQGIKFRNAICYEATSSEIYSDDVNFVLASSNNAWFTPSIEPTLQKLLMKYYARKHGVTIYHSTNDKGTRIVR
jgi:apolipoprotein N-acyltransferase